MLYKCGQLLSHTKICETSLKYMTNFEVCKWNEIPVTVKASATVATFQCLTFSVSGTLTETISLCPPGY